MVNGSIFNLDARQTPWDGISGKVAPAGLTAIEDAVKAEVESGNVVAKPGQMAADLEGIGWTLKVYGLTAKSALYRTFVLQGPEAFKAQTGTDLRELNGVIA
jgi:hypothetical protein